MQISIAQKQSADISPGWIKYFLSLLLLLQVIHPGSAGAGGLNSPERVGLALTCGHSYDPDPTFMFTQLTGMLQYDYKTVWRHRAPEPLRFKLEANLGMAEFRGEQRLFGSVNMLAQYYLPPPLDRRFRPYVEAGIGLIYSDFQVEGQGLRLNFNPQAGLGCDITGGGNELFFAGLRIVAAEIFIPFVNRLKAEGA